MQLRKRVAYPIGDPEIVAHGEVFTRFVLLDCLRLHGLGFRLRIRGWDSTRCELMNRDVEVRENWLELENGD